MTSTTLILNYAGQHPVLTVADIVAEFGMKLNTARQLLSRLTLSGQLHRIGYGRYAISKEKQDFPLEVPSAVKSVYKKLHSELPLVDFCVYSGSVFQPLQHHVAVNNAIYVETNRDTVETVFARLKETYDKVYYQPDARFINDYVDLSEECIIVKPLVTESPMRSVDDVPSPTLEKLLVDILKDPDFDYMHGAEYDYMLENALNDYNVSSTRLLRYARRRGLGDTLNQKLENASSL